MSKSSFLKLCKYMKIANKCMNANHLKERSLYPKTDYFAKDDLFIANFWKPPQKIAQQCKSQLEVQDLQLIFWDCLLIIFLPLLCSATSFLCDNAPSDQYESAREPLFEIFTQLNASVTYAHKYTTLTGKQLTGLCLLPLCLGVCLCC